MKLNKRYKPMYKKLLKLQLQNFELKKLKKLNKAKWFDFSTKIERFYKRRKSGLYLFDHNIYSKPNYLFKLKRKFKMNLISKQKFSFFYGNLLTKYLKFIVNKSLNSNKSKPQDFLIQILESRIDVLLFRAHFVKTIKEARQLILHGHVRVNGIKQTYYKHVLKKGDLIEISLKKIPSIQSNIFTKSFYPLVPSYLQINYNILQIKLIDKPSIHSILTHYNFFIDFDNMLFYFKN